MPVYKHQEKWRYDFWKNSIRHRKGGFKTKQDAKMAEAEARKNLKRINTDFIGLCEKRLEDLEVNRTRKYFREYKLFIEKLTVRWGKKKEITRADVDQYLLECAKKSGQKANKHLRYIKALFNFGMERELASENPASRVRKFSVIPKRRYVPPEADIQKALDTTEEEKVYLLTIIYTMGRISEIHNLKWEDVFDDYLILRTRKAKNSDLTERKIPLSKVLKKALKQLKRTTEHVFPNPKTGKPYVDRKLFMRGLCKKAKVKLFGFHALRHYGASKLASEGVPITDIQVLLGHQRVTTTDIYLRSLKPSLKKAVEKIKITP